MQVQKAKRWVKMDSNQGNESFTEGLDVSNNVNDDGMELRSPSEYSGLRMKGVLGEFYRGKRE